MSADRKPEAALYEKAAAIAIKLEEIDSRTKLRPEAILRKATSEEIDWYYHHICGGGGIVPDMQK